MLATMGKNSKAIEDERPAPIWDPRVEPGKWDDHDGQWDVPVGSAAARRYRRMGDRFPIKEVKTPKQIAARVRSAA